MSDYPRRRAWRTRTPSDQEESSVVSMGLSSQSRNNTSTPVAPVPVWSLACHCRHRPVRLGPQWCKCSAPALVPLALQSRAAGPAVPAPRGGLPVPSRGPGTPAAHGSSEAPAWLGQDLRATGHFSFLCRLCERQPLRGAEGERVRSAAASAHFLTARPCTEGSTHLCHSFPIPKVDLSVRRPAL